MLETNTQQKVEELVNIDRRVIGRWAKEANKTKINNCIGTRSTYKIFGTGKGWWPELEVRLYQVRLYQNYSKIYYLLYFCDGIFKYNLF